jgi:hypothetical protein
MIKPFGVFTDPRASHIVCQVKHQLFHLISLFPHTGKDFGVESLPLTKILLLIHNFATCYPRWMDKRPRLRQTKKYFRPHPRGLLIGIYKFYENWSTETSRKEWLKGVICYAYRSLRQPNLQSQRLRIEMCIKKAGPK